MELWIEKRRKIYIKFIVILCLFFIFLPLRLSASPKIGVIYPSIFITEELASFTQSLIWYRAHKDVDVVVVNSKPDKASLLSLYKFLKKRGINTFIVKDEGVDLSSFYENTKAGDTFFSFSLYIENIGRKNVYRVLPNYKYIIQEFIKYSKKNGAPPICILTDALRDQDLKVAKGLLKSYNNRWKLLKIDEILTPFGIKDGIIDKNSKVFIYTNIYKKAGIVVQLLKEKYKNLSIVLYENIVSPSFLSFVEEKNNIIIEGDIEPNIYKSSYQSFKNSFKESEFLGSLYDFAKLKILIDLSEGKASKVDIFDKYKNWNGKVLFRNLKNYE